jgi:hypothetical protein
LTEPYSHEIRFLTFALFPNAFNPKAADGTPSEIIAASHGGAPTYAFYETGCLACDNADDLDECYDRGQTCIKLNLLNRENCSSMADYIQPYCEGIDTIAPNTVVVSGVGVPGISGCQEAPSNTDSPRKYGRDWIESSEVSDFNNLFSSDMKAAFLTGDMKSKIGPCCGNDLKDDPGTLMKDIAYPDSDALGSKYICINKTYDAAWNPVPTGNFMWLNAEGIDNFKIFYVNNRSNADASFAAVSNTNNWFICDTDAGGNDLSDLYEELETFGNGVRESGVLMQEYDVIPKPEPLLAKGTELLEGEESEVPDAAGGGTNADDDEGGYRYDSLDDDAFLGAIDFTSIEGAGAVTRCDKDGDGYDGAWSQDPSAGDPDLGGAWDKTETCSNPLPPYDCDDWTGDDEIDHLARMRHPGRVDYCLDEGACGSERGDCDLDCNPSTSCIEIPGSDVDPEEFNATPDAQFLYPRFICHNVDGAGDFAECDGWSLAFAYNKQQARREGSALHTLRDFSFFQGESGAFSEEEIANRNNKNYVLRYGVNKAPSGLTSPVGEDEYYRMPLYSVNDELRITNWSHYGDLEFYIWFTTNFEVELWLGKIRPGEHPGLFRSYMFPVKLRVVDYVVNEPELKKWLHVSIPIDEILIPGFAPEVILFASDPMRLSKLGTIVRAADIDREFSNIIGVDKIHFRPKKDDPHFKPGDENYFCTGTWPPTWISDLDQTAPIPNIPETDNPGREACEAIPSYGWTGSMCCGDDTGSDTDYDPATGAKKVGASTFKEFYADDISGCWAGNVLVNNSRVMIIRYDLVYSGFSGTITRSCTNNTCTYDLPPVKNAILTNDYADVYDLAFVNGGYFPIGNGALSPTDHSYLKAENVPMQVLYLDSGDGGEYWGCNADPDLIVPLEDTVRPGDNRLIPAENLLVSEGSTCTIKGGYFCDRPDGANTGWNGEPLVKYPGTNLTMRDGSEVETTPKDIVFATYRIEAKRNYNLIRNGGFENV